MWNQTQVDADSMKMFRDVNKLLPGLRSFSGCACRGQDLGPSSQVPRHSLFQAQTGGGNIFFYQRIYFIQRVFNVCDSVFNLLYSVGYVCIYNYYSFTKVFFSLIRIVQDTPKTYSIFLTLFLPPRGVCKSLLLKAPCLSGSGFRDL